MSATADGKYFPQAVDATLAVGGGVAVGVAARGYVAVGDGVDALVVPLQAASASTQTVKIAQLMPRIGRMVILHDI